jgi:hypothetical protein
MLRQASGDFDADRRQDSRKGDGEEVPAARVTWCGLRSVSNCQVAERSVVFLTAWPQCDGPMG